MSRYRITVRGRLAARTLANLDAAFEESVGHESSYLIDIVDQADLYGMLDLFQRTGVALVSVVEVQGGR